MMKTKWIKTVIGSFALFCFVFAAGAKTAVLTFDGGNIVMPADPGEPREERVSLPWGTAIQKSYEVFDSNIGSTYHFATFEFVNRKKVLDAAGLRKVREYFLKNRGCTAKILAEKHLVDASGRVWPQTVFAGVCEAPVRFQIAVLIADGRLFWFEVYRNIFDNPNSEKMTMDEALGRFVAGFNVEIK